MVEIITFLNFGWFVLIKTFQFLISFIYFSYHYSWLWLTLKSLWWRISFKSFYSYSLIILHLDNQINFFRLPLLPMVDSRFIQIGGPLYLDLSFYWLIFTIIIFTLAYFCFKLICFGIDYLFYKILPLFNFVISYSNWWNIPLITIIRLFVYSLYSHSLRGYFGLFLLLYENLFDLFLFQIYRH